MVCQPSLKLLASRLDRNRRLETGRTRSKESTPETGFANVASSSHCPYVEYFANYRTLLVVVRPELFIKKFRKTKMHPRYPLCLHVDIFGICPTGRSPSVRCSLDISKAAVDIVMVFYPWANIPSARLRAISSQVSLTRVRKKRRIRSSPKERRASPAPFRA